MENIYLIASANWSNAGMSVFLRTDLIVTTGSTTVIFFIVSSMLRIVFAAVEALQFCSGMLLPEDDEGNPA